MCDKIQLNNFLKIINIINVMIDCTMLFRLSLTGPIFD